MSKFPFAKPWCSFADQVATLESRGMVVADRPAAEAFLAHANYYRFSGYGLAFESSRHAFIPGTAFEQVRAAYEFDWVLRDLIAEALEIVEVDVRTAIAYCFGQQHGAFGHVDPRRFYWDAAKHAKWLDKVREETERSSELFITHFGATYAEFPDLPIWMATEVMSFGALSQMFSHMDKGDQRPIGSRYGVQAYFLKSWLHHLVHVRNVCAHHSRLWDRKWAIKPELPPSNAWAAPRLPSNMQIFATMLILNQMLRCAPAAEPLRLQWRQRMEAHLATPPSCADPLGRMGLPANWASHPLWK